MSSLATHLINSDYTDAEIRDFTPGTWVDVFTGYGEHDQKVWERVLIEEMSGADCMEAKEMGFYDRGVEIRKIRFFIDGAFVHSMLMETYNLRPVWFSSRY